MSLFVDLFAGGGGASLGAELATGESPDIAINHDAAALAMHEANHPRTRHLKTDVRDVDPLVATNGEAVDGLWASPTCIFFSKAKSGALDRKTALQSRSLAWVVVRWAKAVRPRVIFLENVEAFQDWGPLLKDGRPCRERRGLTFRRWVRQLEAEGYAVEWRELRACDYGAPTSRKRLFVIARCDGRPIIWPEPTHGPGRLPFRSAAECIDWSIPCPSIFDRKRPLTEATLRRIARGLRRFVLESSDPFIIPLTHAGDARVHSIREPLRTVTCANRGELALVAPTLIQQSYGERKGQEPRALDITKPLGTVVASGIKHAVVTAFLAKNFGGHESPGLSLAQPMSTVTCRDHHALVTATSSGDRRTQVREFLARYNAGQQTELSFGGQSPFEITDIGMRLLVPRELFRAQGFPDSYEIAPLFNGKPLSKTAQIRMAGNSVPPAVAAAIVSANLATRAEVAA